MLEAARRKAQAADEALAAKMKLAEIANETPDQRRLRERRQVEEADNELAGELFDSKNQKSVSSLGSVSATKGLGALSLKTKQDHTNFGNATSSKLSDSSTFNIAAFFKSVVKVLDGPAVTAETLDEIINDLTKIRDTKAKAAKASAGNKKTKKEIKSQVKKHNDIFGGSDYVDKYEESYGGMEDDFM